MDTTGYIINALLVLIVLRQIRETRLDRQSLALPIALVGVAAAYYLRSIPTAGNDAALELGLASLGVALGTLCALFTIVRRTGEGNMVSRATTIAAILWITGIGSRIVFASAPATDSAPQSPTWRWASVASSSASRSCPSCASSCAVASG